jgi:hypothetical protein
VVEPPGERAAAVYAALIGETLAEERAQKDAIHQRAAGVITSAGALVSLLLGLAAVVTATDDLRVPGLARCFLGIAVALFVGSAGAAIVTFFPRRYVEPDPSDLDKLLQPEFWNAAPRAAHRRVAEQNVMIIRWARIVNGRKIRWLMAALVLEALAVALVGVAVLIFLA